MFTVDSGALVTVHPKEATAVDQTGGKVPFWDQEMLGAIIQGRPGEWAVKLWNQLPDVTPIHTPPGEAAAKFRNKQTAVERIWTKLAELYPDAILETDMPKRKAKRETVSNTPTHCTRAAKSADHPKTRTRKTSEAAATTNGRKSAWAAELTEALRKRFKPGDSFELQDVYRLIPQFQKRHPDNKNVAARLRATLAQDLRGAGVVKSSAKGKYRLMAA